MPYSSGPEQSGPNLAHWIGRCIGTGARSAADEISFLSQRANTASPSQKSAWVKRTVVGTAMVGGEYVLLNPLASRLDDVLSLAVSWLVLFLLPTPTPRLLLLLARFVAVGASLMNLRMGMQRLETLFPGLASWTILFAAVWVGLLFVGLLWTARALKPTLPPVMATTAHHSTTHVPVQSPRPTVSFKDVGGMSRVKDEIRLVAENRLRHNSSGVTRNGILLYGPQGTGKNLIAEATAGEYRVGFQHVRCPELIGVHIGSTAAEIRRVFESAYQCRPLVLFLDEIDSIGSRKQAQGNGTDAGGAGREYNAITTQLMQSIDESRQWDGFLLVGTTNVLDGLEPTLIREGRFDAKLRLDLPDANGREEIL